MLKQSVSLVEFQNLYNILREIDYLFAFEILNYKTTEDFLNQIESDNTECKDLSIIISKVVGYKGKINWDITKPDGAKQKLLDNGKMKSIGWIAPTSLEQGINKLYKWYLNSF